jgi:spore coat polysaccharide biosynthesis protein SpsF
MKIKNISNFNKSNDYRNKIHDLIPGGAHTYSKGDDQFPLLSPAAISHGKGAKIWDLDGNEYLDCSMGLTSVSLGHAYEPVLERVIDELKKGVNFQRPSYIEKEMAETFLDLVPVHQMIKFAKNGSIVTTAAIKLARAYTGRNIIAFPKEHPFYSYDDWFIGKTDCSKGIPNAISDLTVTFNACNLESLRELFQKYPNQIAAIITEPEKNGCGLNCNCSIGVGEFLKQAIELCHQNGALFIVDEMVTGFKTDFPGSIKKYDIEPDLATWGKGIANGFSFCALTGKKEIMELGGIRNKGAEKVFLISTTHGGETHAIAAGLATIDIFKKENVLSHLHEIGKSIIQKCTDIINSNSLQHHIKLIPSIWLPVFSFHNKDGVADQYLRTLMMQEMIKRGVLFQGSFVPCFSHTLDQVDYFAAAFQDSLTLFKKGLEDEGGNLLVGEPAKAVFRRFL